MAADVASWPGAVSFQRERAGADGQDGEPGANGVDGVAAGFPFTFSSATAMADPGTGSFRFNNATFASITAAAFGDQSAAPGNADVSAAVLSWDDSTNPSSRGLLLIKKASAPQNFMLFRISGSSVDNAGWTQLALAPVAAAGAFANGNLCSAEFSATGDFPGAATDNANGVVDQATNAEIRSAAPGAHAIMAEDLETAAAQVALTDAATIAVDWDAGINFTLTAAGNRTIGNPTNGQPGTHRAIMVQGNNATDRTITFGNQFFGELPTIADCDNARWYLLTIYCHTATHFVASAKRANG